MNHQVTINNLNKLGLQGMAESFEAIMSLPMNKRPAVERAVAKMVEEEMCRRQNSLAQRLLKAAKLRYRVFLDDITCSAERNLTADQLAELSDCSFVRQGLNILITGQTGCGKSHLACALGRQACCLGLKTVYFNLNHFIDELVKVRLDGTYQKLLQKLARKNLVILEDFGLQPLTPDARTALLTLLEDRYGNGATIITSQLPVSQWYDYIGEPTFADAIMDRLCNSGIQIDLRGESLRKNKRSKYDMNKL